MRATSIQKISVPSAPFYCQCTIALKIKSIEKKKTIDENTWKDGFVTYIEETKQIMVWKSRIRILKSGKCCCH